MNKDKETIKTQTATIWLDDNGILHSVYLEGVDVEVEHTTENAAVFKQLAKAKKVPILIDIRGVNSVTREARGTASSPEAINIAAATVLLISSPVSRVIGNFFMGLNKPPYPIKLFTSEEKAIAWLTKYLKNEIENE